ncbi:adenine phosphoribosyltransferase [Chishuiella changwenlii]|jgi:adenine phosphoribosyltransferase|uniref:Adenine phosphoribosyltransferase n=1 Tax=Chishuiella changwenlii TaxID=1434701 RepID=A0A1M6V1D0_9FLAO|nr:adenine phosphoribosyltransferase [Chishuiella changwenlii]GGF02145.1 adenine phosphoribosyltransferase [Chishuiella changwenlii]SHK75175.1 adenine phosphoribosyltransferase [Chishuiella changwenlii]
MSTLQEKINDTIVDVIDFPKEGIVYKDITPLFLDATLSGEIVDEFVKQAKGKVDVVCGIESRGFLYGIQIAQKLNVPFVLIRKAGKLPPPTINESYDLEYGQATIEINPNYIKEGDRVLIHDDVLATGGTAEACAKLINKCGGKISQFSFIVDLTFLNGKDKLTPFTEEIISLTEY